VQVSRMGALLSVVIDHREALAEQRRLAKHPLVGAALPPSPGAVQRLPAPE
jgi:hypothetical protein